MSTYYTFYENELSSSSDEEDIPPELLWNNALLQKYMHKIETAYTHEKCVEFGIELFELFKEIPPRAFDKPLYSAVFLRNENAIDQFLSWKAQANDRIICMAVSWCSVTTLKKLLEKRIYEKENFTPLHAIAKIHRPDAGEICEILIEHLYSVNAETRGRGERKQTPLFIAVKHHNINVIGILLRYGANPFIFSEIRMSPLFLSFTLPLDEIKDIVRYAALYVKGPEQETIFMLFFQNSKGKLLKKFAQRCLAEVNILKKEFVIGSKGTITLYQFVVSQYLELKEFLLDFEIGEILYVLSLSQILYYKGVVLRKFKPEEVLPEILQSKWFTYSGNRKVFLNTDCISFICSFLSKDDVMSLWMAFDKM